MARPLESGLVGDGGGRLVGDGGDRLVGDGGAGRLAGGDGGGGIAPRVGAMGASVGVARKLVVSGDVPEVLVDDDDDDDDRLYYERCHIRKVKNESFIGRAVIRLTCKKWKIIFNVSPLPKLLNA